MIARVVFFVAAAALIAYAAGLVLCADSFPAPGEPGVQPRHVVLLTVATLAVSLLHVGACLIAHRAPPRLLHVLLVAGAARLILLFGAPGPILEGDHARLRFDARMVNQGVNPYEFKPVHLMDEDPTDVLLTGPELERLRRARAAMTASNEAPRPEDVRRPDLRTSATPLSLWIGAVADRFKPQSTLGLAFLVLVADICTVFFLMLALRAMRRPLAWVLVYAWCPVLLKEFYCTLALDAFVLTMLSALVYCVVSGRRLLAAVPTALCAALRPALLLLTPVLGRRLGILGVMLVIALFLLPYVPFHSPDVPVARTIEGQLHVWRHHEYNSVLENLLHGALRYMPTRAESSLTIAGVTIVEPDERLDTLLAKVICVVALLGVVTYLMIRITPDQDPGARTDPGLTDLFIVLVTLLVVSPVLHPWHALWLLPILAVRPFGLAWLTLPGLLSLSYLTHLGGPDAADLTIFGGKLSFRVLEFGAFGLFLALDVLWSPVLFDGAARRDHEGSEEDMPLGSYDLDETLEPVANQRV